MIALLLALFLIQAPVTIQNQNGSLAGRVLKTDGLPAAGMRVAAMAVSEANTANGTVLASLGATDAEGRYRLDNIPPGRYYVLAGLVDFPTYYPGETTVAAARAVEVTAQKVVEGIDFTALRPATVSVRGRLVRISNPLLLPVTIRSALGPPLQIQTTPKADGSFEFLRVPLGTYIIAARGAGAKSVTLDDKDFEVELFPQSESPGVKVSGKVVGISNSTAVVLSSPYSDPLQTPLRPDGTFEFAKVPAGNYVVQLMPPGIASLGSLQVVDKDVTDFEIRMPFFMGITGRIISENGNPPERARLQFRGERRISGLNVTGENFQIQLPEGEHRVSVSLPAEYVLKSIAYGGEEVTQGVLKFDRSMPAKELLITVSRLPDDLVPHFKVSGRITVPGPGVRLSLAAQTGKSPPDLDVNPDGTFEFPRVDPDLYLVRITGRWLESISENLEVGSDITGLVLNVRAMASITGRVLITDSAGNALPVPQFLLVGFRYRSGGSQTPVGNDGSFRRELIEEQYIVTVNNLPAGYSVKSITSGGVDLKTTPLKVVEATSPPDIQIAIEYASR